MKLDTPIGRTAALVIPFAILAAIFLWSTRGIIAAAGPVGWDTPGHLFMVSMMSELLREGRVSGYTLLWDGGVPLFRFYPPLFFIIAAIPTALSGGLVAPVVTVQFLLWIAPILYLLAVWWCASVWVKGHEAVLVLPLAGAFLSIHEFGPQGIGLGSIYYTGLLPAFLGLMLFVLFFGSLGRVLELQSLKRMLCSGVLFGLLILTHTLTSIFALFVMVVLLIQSPQWNRVRTISLIGVMGFAISSWWVIPFLNQLEFSSGAPIHAEQFGDPLSWLFPFGENLPRDISQGALSAEFRRAVPGLAVQVPEISVSITAGLALVGLYCLVRRGELLLPILLCISVLLMYGRFLTGLVPVPLHAYRWAGAVWTVQLLVATYGLGAVMRFVRAERRGAQFAVAALLSLGVGVEVLVSRPFGLLSSSSQSSVVMTLDRSTLGGASSLDALLNHIKGNRPSGRVAVESSGSGYLTYGSPHILMERLPLEADQAVMPGMFVESSLLAPYIVGLLRRGGSQLVWGDADVAKLTSIEELSAFEFVERLRFFGISSLVAASPGLRAFLAKDSAVAAPSFSSGDLSLFDFGGAAPLVSSLRYKPFLFVDHGGMKFKEFAKWYFSSRDLLDLHVFYRPGGLAALTPDEREQIGGIIVSAHRGSVLDQPVMEGYFSVGPVVVLNHDHTVWRPAGRRVHVIPVVQGEESVQILAEILRRYHPINERALGVVKYTLEDRCLTGIPAGTSIVRVGFMSNIKGLFGEKPFVATPGFVGFLGYSGGKLCL